MSNFGTSNKIKIGGESFSPIKSMTLSPVDGSGLTVLPPSPNGNQPSEAMYAYQNTDRDFLFQKISPPLYGNDREHGLENAIARTTGRPANEPDYIADVHYIGIMRSIDNMLRHRYKGTITGSYDTPGTV